MFRMNIIILGGDIRLLYHLTSKQMGAGTALEQKLEQSSCFSNVEKVPGVERQGFNSTKNNLKVSDDELSFKTHAIRTV